MDGLYNKYYSSCCCNIGANNSRWWINCYSGRYYNYCWWSYIGRLNSTYWICNGCWWSTEELGYTKTLELVKNVFIPHEHKDIRGTCGRGDRGCRCRSCWVLKAEEAYRKSVEKPAEGKTAQVR